LTDGAARQIVDEPAEQGELLAILAPLKSEIVEVDATQTGTPLPPSYKPAPALVG
jgi:hemoglobin